MATVIAAPNALQALNLLLKKNQKKSSDFNSVRVLSELRRQKLIDVNQSAKNKFAFNLTPAGAQRLQKIMIDEIIIPNQKPWDKKWRLVAFDIPVKNSKQRLYFLAELRRLNFYMLQRSLWLYPYPCFKQLGQLARHYNVLRYCSFFEVSQIDKLSAHRLLKYFENLR